MAPKACQVDSNNASVSANTWTPATWTRTLLSLGFSFATGKIIAPDTSFYLLWTKTENSTTNATDRGVRITYNGASGVYATGRSLANGQTIVGAQVADILSMTQGDYCGVDIFQSGAGSENTDAPTIVVKLPNTAGCRAYTTTPAASAGANQWTTIALTSENYDTRGWHDNATNNSRITVDYAGLALIVGNTSTVTGGGIRYTRVLKNGSQYGGYSGTNAPGGGDSGNSLITIVAVQPGDYFEVQAWQSTGGNVYGSLAVVQIPAVAAAVGLGSSQSLGPSQTQWSIDSEVLDLNNMHTGSQAAYFAPRTSYYFWFGGASFNYGGFNPGNTSASIKKNGVAQSAADTRVASNDGSTSPFPLSALLTQMTAGQYVELWVGQGTAAAKNTDTNSQFAGFDIDFDSLLAPGPYNPHVSVSGGVSW